jgi:hypothetical protein
VDARAADGARLHQPRLRDRLAARERWTASSRAAFADALFGRWVAAGARRLASHARQWAGTDAAARAQAALDALRHRGTDAALRDLTLGDLPPVVFSELVDDLRVLDRAAPAADLFGTWPVQDCSA